MLGKHYQEILEFHKRISENVFGSYMSRKWKSYIFQQIKFYVSVILLILVESLFMVPLGNMTPGTVFYKISGICVLCFPLTIIFIIAIRDMYHFKKLLIFSKDFYWEESLKNHINNFLKFLLLKGIGVSGIIAILFMLVVGIVSKKILIIIPMTLVLFYIGIVVNLMACYICAGLSTYTIKLLSKGIKLYAMFFLLSVPIAVFMVISFTLSSKSATVPVLIGKAGLMIISYAFFIFIYYIILKAIYLEVEYVWKDYHKKCMREIIGEE